METGQGRQSFRIVIIGSSFAAREAMMTITTNSIIKRSPEIVYSDMDGETVMMSIEQGSYFGIDAIGSHIWNVLEEEISVEALCARLCEKYDVEESQCQQDVIRLLEKMQEHNIIEIA